MNKAIVVWMWDPPVLPEGTPIMVAPPEIRHDIQKLEAKREKRLNARFPNRRPPLFKQPMNMRIARVQRPARIPRMFDASHVNTMRSMIERHMGGEPHDFVCISDKSDGLDPRVRWLKTPDEAKELGELKSPEGDRFPSCYRRLWVFSKAARVLGERILCLDIDLVVVRDLKPVWALQHDFVGWRPYRDWGKQRRVGGGQYLLTTGSKTHVWDEFKGASSIYEARLAGFRGSDQAWLSYKLAAECTVWGRDAGLYSVRDIGPTLELPEDATLVQFNGQAKPWHHCEGKVSPVQWVLDNWR